MCGRKRMIIIAHSAQLSPHCTGGGIRSDGGSSARSGRAKQRSLLCPLSENLRPIPTEVPCGHFWRHLLVTKGGKSAPRRRRRIEGTELSQRKRESISLFFCAFGLIQKHQKIKHGEK